MQCGFGGLFAILRSRRPTRRPGRFRQRLGLQSIPGFRRHGQAFNQIIRQQEGSDPKKWTGGFKNRKENLANSQLSEQDLKTARDNYHLSQQPHAQFNKLDEDTSTMINESNEEKQGSPWQQEIKENIDIDTRKGKGKERSGREQLKKIKVKGRETNAALGLSESREWSRFLVRVSPELRLEIFI